MKSTSIAIPASQINSARLEKIGEGRERVVYSCADYPHVVFKAQKRTAQRDLDAFALKSFFLKYLPGYHNYSLELEYRTYVKFCLNAPIAMDALPVARLYGFVASEFGMLQICEKITVDGQNAGPTLAEIGRSVGLTDQDIVGLNRFASKLLHSDMSTRDVSINNVVKGLDPHGVPRFALVDGMGDVRLIPLSRFSKKVRRHNLEKSFRRYGRLGIQFNSDTFTFTRRDESTQFEKAI